MVLCKPCDASYGPNKASRGPDQMDLKRSLSDLIKSHHVPKRPVMDLVIFSYGPRKASYGPDEVSY